MYVAAFLRTVEKGLDIRRRRRTNAALQKKLYKNFTQKSYCTIHGGIMI